MCSEGGEGLFLSLSQDLPAGVLQRVFHLWLKATQLLKETKPISTQVICFTLLM